MEFPLYPYEDEYYSTKSPKKGAHSIPVLSAKILRGNGPDRVFFSLPESLAKDVHGDYHEHWGNDTLKLDCTQGQAENALRALGFNKATILDISPNSEYKEWTKIYL